MNLSYKSRLIHDAVAIGSPFEVCTMEKWPLHDVKYHLFSLLKVRGVK